MEAGFWARLAALFLDTIIVGVPLYIISVLLFTHPDSQKHFRDLIIFLYSLLLPVFWGGCTIGKRICNIQIRKIEDQSPPGFGTMLLRNVVAGLIYSLTLGIGVIVSAFMVGLREDKRAIHDFIAGTEVVYD